MLAVRCTLLRVKGFIVTKIINSLKARGESSQFIEGYLTAIASSLTEMQQAESLLFLEKIIKLTEQGNLLLAPHRQPTAND